MEERSVYGYTIPVSMSTGKSPCVSLEDTIYTALFRYTK